MLENSYAEFLVKRKTPIYYQILKVILIIFAALSVAIGLLFWNATYSVSIFIAIGICFGVYYLVRSFSVEYEYIFTGGDLTIDKVIDQSRRKTVVVLDIANAELIAPYNSHHIDSYRHNTNMKIYDYSSMTKNDRVYAIAHIEGENSGLYLFEPNEKMLKIMRNFAPRKVIMQ